MKLNKKCSPILKDLMELRKKKSEIVEVKTNILCIHLHFASRFADYKIIPFSITIQQLWAEEIMDCHINQEDYNSEAKKL